MKTCLSKNIVVPALLALLSTLNLPLSTAHAQGTAFTYQGQLQNNGNLAAGTYNLTFALFTNSTGGTAVAGPVTNNGVAVSNGLFTVAIDFGVDVWNGATNWLEIAVETNGAGSFTTLTPRQQLTPTPYAIFAEGANAAGLNGTIPMSSLSGAYGGMVSFTNPASSFTGSGSGLSGVNAALLGGLASSNFWQLGGNVAAAGSQILGTLNNQPLDFYADNVRAMRLILRTDATKVFSNAPNVIGGSSVNLVKFDVVGGTVGGGGGNDTNGVSYPNQVNADFGTISGGLSNTVNGSGSFIGGGGYDGSSFLGNSIKDVAAVIGGGMGNSILSGGSYSFIGGGLFNTASGDLTVVGGGYSNFATGQESAVGGGYYNSATNSFATVAGGYLNAAYGNSAFVGGGSGNTASGIGSFIGGGGNDGTVYAGNYVNANAATIGGGLGNTIPASSRYAVISGGVSNTASAYYASVGGGYLNVASGTGAFVGGGGDDGIDASLDGLGNVASGGAAVVAGGMVNTASGRDSAVGGGLGNTASGLLATAPGGQGNTAGGTCSFAAGTFAQVTHNGSFAWADNSSYSFSDTAANQFSARATGGVRFVTAIDSLGNPSAGVKLGPGDTAWSTISDRNAKKNFQPVDTVAVLNKLSAIPIQQWNYKWEADTNTPNLGPMAQDFKAAFYPGRDDTSISTLEFDGVELAAIQGLNQKLNEKDAEIADLKARLEKLEQLINSMKGDNK